MIAQNSSLPKNLKIGKCYERCLTYDKPILWKEIECGNRRISLGVTAFHKTRTEEQQIKFIEYQKKLINLGYKIEVIGLLNDDTVFAHNKYLKFKANEKRKKARLERKAKRKNRKQG